MPKQSASHNCFFRINAREMLILWLAWKKEQLITYEDCERYLRAFFEGQRLHGPDKWEHRNGVLFSDIYMTKAKRDFILRLRKEKVA